MEYMNPRWCTQRHFPPDGEFDLSQARKPADDGIVQGARRVESHPDDDGGGKATRRDRGLGRQHGQGVAYHAVRRGIPVQIWTPRSPPLIKLSATRAYGADIVVYGDNYDEACEAAVAQSVQRNVTFVHPFDDDEVIAGQGTLGLEILIQNLTLDVMFIPVGGGGLIGGVGCAVKGRNPHVEMVGVQTSRLPSMKAALDSEGPVNPAS